MVSNMCLSNEFNLVCRYIHDGGESLLDQYEKGTVMENVPPEVGVAKVELCLTHESKGVHFQIVKRRELKLVSNMQCLTNV